VKPGDMDPKHFFKKDDQDELMQAVLVRREEVLT
jgi:hypothetical protein